MTDTKTFRPHGFTPRRTAAVAGAAYLVTYVMSVFAEFYVRPTLIAGDAARTASNIVAHAQLFRIALVADLLTGAGVVILNLGLYELLAPVHRSVARFAAFWRLVEVAVGSAITVSGFIVLSLLSGADYLRAFDARELQSLARLFVAAHASGYAIVLLFYSFGSTTYMYLLVRSRYVPQTLAVLSLAGSALVAVFALTRLLFPNIVAAGSTAVRNLPPIALVLLAAIFVPIFLFEAALGLWLLVKGVRVPNGAEYAG